jgi:hypothetical protein
MEKGYRALLLGAAGMIGVEMPAFAQPANLRAPPSQQQPLITPSIPSHHPFLAAAHDDVENHQWHAAEDQLELSETFLLNAGVTSSSGVVTSPSPAMPYIIQARMAVKQRDQVDALVAIDKAMATMSDEPRGSGPPEIVAQQAGPLRPSTSLAAASSPSFTPMVTKALLPGHWELAGWQSRWVPPDTAYRPVQSNMFIPGHSEYRGGAWVWVGGHYAADGS